MTGYLGILKGHKRHKEGAEMVSEVALESGVRSPARDKKRRHAFLARKNREQSAGIL